ncbi:FecR family protein [Mangrovibacterium diazotrophicum]|uniref:FecR family protein n=2 Tax=Mangrovibacterium diazotrophicum TaxID=1261403 RepID=A0A419W5M1_9BACT|nr:FecR family protein [Mangrovibacterium diazotrophicum]
MSSRDLNKKAEDILTEDALIDKLMKKSFSVNERSADFELAGNIVDALKAGKQEFAGPDKILVGQRIQESIKRERKSRLIVWTSSVAAIAILLVGLTFWLNSQNQSPIRQYASMAEIPVNTKFTRLVIPGAEDVQLMSTESSVSYSANGEEIHIQDSMSTETTLAQLAQTYNTLVVPYGKRSHVVLPDQTEVWLNSGSKLTYPVKFGADKREVFLQGEALFDVTHDEQRPFSVLTEQLDVRVLGTSFNVSAYEDDSVVQTVLVRGSVELEYKSKLWGISVNQKMVPGTLAVFDATERSVEQSLVDTDQFTSWKDGYLILENSPLSVIAKKLSRYYNMRISFVDPALEAETFSGYLDLGNSALEVMGIISEITGNQVEETSDGILFKGKDVHS